MKKVSLRELVADKIIFAVLIAVYYWTWARNDWKGYYTWYTPACPEVDDDNFTLQRREGERLALLPVSWRKYNCETYFRKSCLLNKYKGTRTCS